MSRMNTSTSVTMRAGAEMDVAGEAAVRVGWWPMVRSRLHTAWSPRSVWLGPGPVSAGSTLSGPSAQHALAAWGQWCEANAGSCCELGLSGHWLWSTVLNGQGGEASGGAQARAVVQAQSQWAHYLGLDAAALDEAWLWRALPQAATPLVCAMPADLLDEIGAVAASTHVRIDWLGPWWVTGAQTWLASPPEQGRARLSLHEPGLVTHLDREFKQGEPARLVRVWTEPCAQADPSAAGLPLSLLDMAPASNLHAAPFASLLEGDAIKVVLKGAHPAWRALA
jgi:hypothetical protein